LNACVLLPATFVCESATIEQRERVQEKERAGAGEHRTSKTEQLNLADDGRGGCWGDFAAYASPAVC